MVMFVGLGVTLAAMNRAFSSFARDGASQSAGSARPSIIGAWVTAVLAGVCFALAADSGLELIRLLGSTDWQSFVHNLDLQYFSEALQGHSLDADALQQAVRQVAERVELLALQGTDVTLTSGQVSGIFDAVFNQALGLDGAPTQLHDLLNQLFPLDESSVSFTEVIAEPEALQHFITVDTASDAGITGGFSPAFEQEPVTALAVAGAEAPLSTALMGIGLDNTALVIDGELIGDVRTSDLSYAFSEALGDPSAQSPHYIAFLSDVAMQQDPGLLDRLEGQGYVVFSEGQEAVVKRFVANQGLTAMFLGTARSYEPDGALHALRPPPMLSLTIGATLLGLLSGGRLKDLLNNTKLNLTIEDFKRIALQWSRA